MTYMLLALILVLGAYTVWLHRRFTMVAEDLRYVHKSWRAASEAHTRATADLRAELQELRRSAPETSSPVGSWFTPYMTIADALNVHPGVVDVMKSLHIGGCTSCSVSSRETLEQAAQGHGVELKVMLARLNALMDSKAPSPGSASAVSPNDNDGLPPTEGGRVLIATGSVPSRD